MHMKEQITNIFWDDTRRLYDYHCFRDVISLDTTYRTKWDHRSLAMFLRFNHYRREMIFRVALLYGDTIKSFKWLFHWGCFRLHHKGPDCIDEMQKYDLWRRRDPRVNDTLVATTIQLHGYENHSLLLLFFYQFITRRVSPIIYNLKSNKFYNFNITVSIEVNK